MKKDSTIIGLLRNTGDTLLVLEEKEKPVKFNFRYLTDYGEVCYTLEVYNALLSCQFLATCTLNSRGSTLISQHRDYSLQDF